jgi:hypothetical protein
LEQIKDDVPPSSWENHQYPFGMAFVECCLAGLEPSIAGKAKPTCFWNSFDRFFHGEKKQKKWLAA